MFGFKVFSNVLLDGDVFCDSGMNLQNLLIWIFLKLKTGVGICLVVIRNIITEAMIWFVREL